ncbi:hypothetical protein KCP71_16015 [Salmonella enterica subsp. enterica]|nr:hypothetical protein KCP71_16015 [Salmonella enterica subsp. enterica]
MRGYAERLVDDCVNHRPVNVIACRVDKETLNRKEWSYNDAVKAVKRLCQATAQYQSL